MFDVSLVKSSLTNLVGFRQPANPKYAIIDTSNRLSESGLFVTDNPYAKIEYIKDNIDYSKISNGDFNTVLKNIKEASSVNVCSNVFNEPDFVDRNSIYTHTANKVEEHLLPVGFVGYEVIIAQDKNVAFRINKAILEFVEAGSLELLVFNSNLKQPIHNVTITYDEFYHMETVDLMINDLGFYKGTFYIGFISDGTKRTYRRNFENSNIENQLKYLSIERQLVQGHSTPTIFNLSQAVMMQEYCGINLDITVVDDYTDFIITNKNLFARAIYIDTIISCLNIYAASLRSNANERSAEELYSRIMLEIEGTRPDDNVISIKGLRPEMIYEISQIRTEVKKLKGGFVGKGYFVDTQN